MSDDENATQNQDSEENSIPLSLQEPTEPATENTSISEPADVLSEAPKTSQEGFEVKSSDIPLPDSEPKIENPSEVKIEEKSLENENIEEENVEEIPTVEQSTESVSEPAEIPENSPAVAEEIEVEAKTPSSENHGQISQNTQTSINEPSPRRVDKTEPETPKPVEPKTTAAQMAPSEPRAQETETKIDHKHEAEKKSEPVVQPLKEKIIYSLLPIKNLLGKANDVLRLGRRKKLDKILALLEKKGRIKNDDVEKLLHVSDATATRYLTQLVKEGKIKRNSRGKYLYYSKI